MMAIHKACPVSLIVPRGRRGNTVKLFSTEAITALALGEEKRAKPIPQQHQGSNSKPNWVSMERKISTWPQGKEAIHRRSNDAPVQYGRKRLPAKGAQ